MNTLNEEQTLYVFSLGVTFKVLSKATKGGTAIVEHTIEPRTFGAPPHKHTHEDEITFVIEGKLTVEQDGIVHTVGPRGFLVKPRGLFHCMWNAGDETVRFLEIITPGNYESFFKEIAPLIPPAVSEPKWDEVISIAARYGWEFNMEPVEGIMKKYGLKG